MQLLKDSEIRRLPTANPAPAQRSAERSYDARIDLHHVLTVIKRGRPLIALVTAVCLGLAILYLLFTPRTYVAESQVMIDTRQQRPILSEQVVSNFEVTPSVVASEVLTIRSNVLLARVVAALDLTNRGEFQSENAGTRGAMTPAQRTEYAIRIIQRNLSVRQSGLSHVILITYGSETPATAADVANEIARQYIAEDVNLKREAARQASTFLEDRIATLADDVEAAEQAVVDYRRAILDEVGRDATALSQLLAELNTELVGLTQARAEAEIRLAKAEELFNSGGVDAVREVMSTPALDALAATYATLASEQARLAATLGTDHARYKTQSVLLEDVLRSMNDEVRKQVAGMRNEVEVARNRENALQDRIAGALSQQTRLDDAAVRQGQLERAAAAARLVFEEFLTRFTETNAQAELQLPQARIIGLATIPAVASEPRTKLVLMLALVLGASTGTALVLVRSAMTREIGSISELEQAAEVPVLAALPSLSERASNWPIGQKSFRNQRLALFQNRIKAVRTWVQGDNSVPANVVMVTSTLPEEGKSTVAISLAYSLGQISGSVVMIDTDLGGCLSRRDFDLDQSEACLVDHLKSGEPPSDELIQYAPDFGVSIIAPMRAHGAPSDLLATPAFRRLVRWAADRFDYVVVDAPSAVNLAASQTVAGCCGSALLVVRTHHTRATLVNAAIGQLRNAGIGRIRAVLSHVRQKEGRSDELQNYQRR